MVNGLMLIRKLQTTLSEGFEDFSGKNHPFAAWHMTASVSGCVAKWPGPS